MTRHLFSITTPGGLRYDVGDVQAIPRRWGQIYETFRRNRRGRIQIVALQPPEERLDTLIHELLHAIHPRWTEKKVRRTAACLTRAVLKDGWKRRTT